MKFKFIFKSKIILDISFCHNVNLHFFFAKMSHEQHVLAWQSLHLTVTTTLELSPITGLVSSLKVFIRFLMVSSVSLKFSPSFNLIFIDLRIVPCLVIKETLPGHHDSIRNIQNDQFNWRSNPLFTQFRLCHVGRESIKEEPRCLWMLLHCFKDELHNFILNITINASDFPVSTYIRSKLPSSDDIK